MKKTLIILTVLQILICNTVFAQSKRGNEWITGAGGTRIKFVNNTIITNNSVYYDSYFKMGNSAICDTNGNLILASDGYNVYDSIGNYIEDGDTLIPKDYFIAHSGTSILSQSSIFLPMDSNKYYFITPTMSDARFADCNANNHCYFDLLLYNVIDMNANGGAGKAVKRMQPLMQNAELRKTQMMACRHANGKDWWLLKQAGDSNKIHKFLFRQDTVIDYSYQQFDTPVWGGWDITGMSTFNNEGNKYATTSHGSSTGKIFLADFDRCYGKLTNPKEIVMPRGSQYNPNSPSDSERLAMGVAFSPNNQFLYVISQFNIWQYDLVDESWFHVAGMDTTWIQFQQYGASYYGADGKLYFGNIGGASKQMSRIDNPDVKGAGCNFCPRCLRLDTLTGTAYAGTPPCMPNYSLGEQICWPESTNDVENRKNNIEVYPNPVSEILNVKCLMLNAKKELYNSVGQLLFTTKENEIDVSRYASGVYYLKCGGAVRKVVIE